MVYVDYMRKKPGPKPSSKVRRAWDADMAYAVGLITSDGCLSTDGRHIIFVSKDLQQVIHFLSALEIENNPIRKKTGGFRTSAWYIQFSDVLFWQWLTTIGLMPNKSKVLGSMKIPKVFFFDFLRGLFDGDGSVYGFRDYRWAQSYMYYLAFTSASKRFLLWLHRMINQQLGTTGHIALSRRAWQLKYAKKDGLAILKAMYYAPSLLCLERKRQRARWLLMTASRYESRGRGGTWQTRQLEGLVGASL